MIHGKGLTVEVCGEQGLWMAGRRQVERHKVSVRIPRGIEIDRRLHARPLSLRHRWIRAKQIIESQTSPPRDRTPAFNANQPRNLLMHREESQEIPNIERDAQARSEPIQSQFPFRNIGGIRSSSVVVVLERGNLRESVPNRSKRRGRRSRPSSFAGPILRGHGSIEPRMLSSRTMSRDKSAESVSG
jgi:hypothetical protein